jgi:hypothetical protein
MRHGPCPLPALQADLPRKRGRKDAHAFLPPLAGEETSRERGETKGAWAAAIGACLALLFLADSPAFAADTIPQLSGHWAKTNFNLEQPADGPAFIVNTLKKADGTLNDDLARIGDITNPLLTPMAAQILKEHGEFSRTGQSIPDPHNQCWLEAPPFTTTIQVEILLLQTKDEVRIVSVNGHHVRRIRMNAPHGTVPKLQGDSVGHYEGDTLVVDTTLIKPSPWPVIDRYGTPHSDQLHVVERYRLIDGKEAADAIRKHRREFNTNDAIPKFDIYGAEFDSDLSKKGLQVEITVEDPKMFTKTWKGLATYRPATSWPEMSCSESTHEITGPDRNVPMADKADF